MIQKGAPVFLQILAWEVANPWIEQPETSTDSTEV